MLKRRTRDSQQRTAIAVRLVDLAVARPILIPNRAAPELIGQFGILRPDEST